MYETVSVKGETWPNRDERSRSYRYRFGKLVQKEIFARPGIDGGQIIAHSPTLAATQKVTNDFDGSDRFGGSPI